MGVSSDGATIEAAGPPEIHAIILTLNEAMHIERCIASLDGQVTSVTIIDSGSNDVTREIAARMGAKVIENTWVNYAAQLNFGIEQLAGKGGWLMRIDADEILQPDAASTLLDLAARQPAHVDGIAVRRRIYFLGRRIRHGSIEPSWQLRLWRNGRGRCEIRWMDEHIKVAGSVFNSNIDISDINLNSLTWWTAKHNNYASREAIDLLNARHGFLPQDTFGTECASAQARTKRVVKEKIYTRLPGAVRSIFYFLYRYIIRLGFLDGREGLYFHLLQGLWYRTLVDAKITEIEDFARQNGIGIVEAIRNRTGIDPLPPGMDLPPHRGTPHEQED